MTAGAAQTAGTVGTVGTVGTAVQDDDPFAAAMAAKPLPADKTHFGEVATVDPWPCVLQKGIGKVLFDPSQHSPHQRRIAIKIEIQPLRGDYVINRETIDTSRDWLKITLPSLRALGADLRTLKGRYAQIKIVPTGETYTNKSGETKDRTAIQFVEFYDSREACEAAAEVFWSQRRSNAKPAVEVVSLPDDLPEAPTPPIAANGNGHTSAPTANDPERAFAAQALPVLWKAAGGDKARFADMLKTNPLIGKHFTMESPEVRIVIGEVRDVADLD